MGRQWNSRSQTQVREAMGHPVEREEEGERLNGSVFSFLSRCSEKAISVTDDLSLSLCHACPRTPLLISEASVFNEHCCFVRALCMPARGRGRHGIASPAGLETVSRNLMPKSWIDPHYMARTLARTVAVATRQANIFQSERARVSRLRASRLRQALVEPAQSSF